MIPKKDLPRKRATASESNKRPYIHSDEEQRTSRDAEREKRTKEEREKKVKREAKKNAKRKDRLF